MLIQIMTAMPQRRAAPRRPMEPGLGLGLGLQRGVFLIEALLGILIFSLGILSLVAMQTAAVSAQSDARYRIEAANLADQMVSEMWLNIDRTTAATVQASLVTFQLNATGARADCNFSGGSSGLAPGDSPANSLVDNWVNTVSAPGTGLPGATASMQQITVSTGAGSFNQVSVTLCWQSPIDASPHRHTVVSFIN